MSDIWTLKYEYVMRLSKLVGFINTIKYKRIEGKEYKHSLQGDIYYELNGQRHREDGPAIIIQDIVEMWYVKGKCHRLNGPAIEWADGTEEFYINGDKYEDKDEWLLATREIKLSQILE